MFIGGSELNMNFINCVDMKRMNVLFVVAAVMVMTAGMMVGCIAEDERGADLKVGEGLPEFEVVMSDGTVVGDDDLRGSVSVVMFFHTGCPDCQQALPVMKRIYDEYAHKGVGFALVSREEGQEVIEAYWAENGLEMPYSAQNDRYVYSLFAQSRIPRIYVNDKDGIIRYIYTDDPVPGYDDLKSAIESLLD